jgi:hypothetical protein
MNKTLRGILIGAFIGLIDVVPMVLQNLTWDANLSAFTLWVVSGLLITKVDCNCSGILKGVIIPFLVLLPSAILIGWGNPASLIPIFVMTLLLGVLLGYLGERFIK